MEQNQKVVVFSDVTKQYPTVTALSSITFSIKKGEIFCLLGPNGSGKTTTIKLITGQITPTSGEVRVNGYNPNKEHSQLIGTIGLVPQDIALYSELTARENLRFHGQLFNIDPGILESRIDEMLKIAGLEKRQHDRVDTYSGGMKRRLQLVRALIHDPELILLDEPTLGVDVQSRNAINEYILKIAESGKSVVVTTNYMQEAEKLADRLIILDNKIVAGPSTIKEVQESVIPGIMIILETEKISSEQGASVFENLNQFIASKLQGQIMLTRTLDSKVTYHIQTPQSTQIALTSLVKFCEEQKLTIFELTVKKPSLEDVFLKLTGKEFRDGV